LKDLGVDESITLNYTLKREDDRVWTEFNRFKNGVGGDLF